MGKQTALKWIAQGSARAGTPVQFEVDSKNGILVRGSASEIRASLDRHGYAGSFRAISKVDPLTLPWIKTLIWTSEVRLRIDLLPSGFNLLEQWEVAVPLWSQQTLASGVGDQLEQVLTASVIHDLRVPVYESGIIFIRRTPTTEDLLAAWLFERERGQDERLAFLRALYQVKPLILALPVTWLE